MFDFFKRRPALQCGGEGLCEILVKGKTCGTIRYRRPTSDEKLDYIYQLQKGLSTESLLKEVDGAGDKKAKKCHEILIRELSIPQARNVFIASTGFIDSEGKSLDNLSTEEQFNALTKYFSFIFVDLVAHAYASYGTVKKKY